MQWTYAMSQRDESPGGASYEMQPMKRNPQPMKRNRRDAPARLRISALQASMLAAILCGSAICLDKSS